MRYINLHFTYLLRHYVINVDDFTHRLNDVQ